jgi:hypothetical protein
MATPTDQQQIRATLRRLSRDRGPEEAVRLTLVEAMNIIGVGTVRDVVRIVWPEPSSVPPLMGAAEAADLLGMQATNLKRLSPPLLPARDTEGNPVIISGRIPAYLRSEVMAAKKRRDAREAAKVAAKVAAA